MVSLDQNDLTHWGPETHICIGNLTIIGSDNGLLPGRRQAIIWTNAGSLLIGPLGTNFSEIITEIETFSLKKIRLKMSSAKRCSFRLDLNVLNTCTCNFLHFQLKELQTLHAERAKQADSGTPKGKTSVSVFNKGKRKREAGTDKENIQPKVSIPY